MGAIDSEHLAPPFHPHLPACCQSVPKEWELVVPAHRPSNMHAWRTRAMQAGCELHTMPSGVSRHRHKLMPGTSVEARSCTRVCWTRTSPACQRGTSQDPQIEPLPGAQERGSQHPGTRGQTLWGDRTAQSAADCQEKPLSPVFPVTLLSLSLVPTTQRCPLTLASEASAE